MSTTQYLCAPQQRVLKLIQVMAGHEVEGLAPAQIAKLNECSASAVTKDLANLKELGWAEFIPTTGRWRLGPQIVQISIQHLASVDRAKRKLDEVTSRYSRGG